MIALYEMDKLTENRADDLFIYLTTIKQLQLHQALEKNHSLREQRLKALTCKAMKRKSSGKRYYVHI